MEAEASEDLQAAVAVFRCFFVLFCCFCFVCVCVWLCVFFFVCVCVWGGGGDKHGMCCDLMACHVMACYAILCHDVPR